MRSHRSTAVVWLAAATTLGLGHAAVSLLWASGSTWLIDTVGGQIEEWARDGGTAVRLALLGVVAVKLVAVFVTWVGVSRGDRPARLSASAASVVLIIYGLTLTVAQGLGLAGAFDLPADADLYALRWHTYLWDPWFAAWGICAAAALLSTRRARRPRAPASLGGGG